MPKQLMKYRVVREHYGEKPYVTGDTREAYEHDVAHLVPHVLVLDGPVEAGGKDADEHDEAAPSADRPAAKAEDAPLNKAESAAPANKAASSRKSKSK